MPRRTSKTVGLASQYQSVGGLLRHYLTTSAELTVHWDVCTAAERCLHSHNLAGEVRDNDE